VPFFFENPIDEKRDKISNHLPLLSEF